MLGKKRDKETWFKRFVQPRHGHHQLWLKHRVWRAFRVFEALHVSKPVRQTDPVQIAVEAMTNLWRTCLRLLDSWFVLGLWCSDSSTWSWNRQTLGAHEAKVPTGGRKMTDLSWKAFLTATPLNMCLVLFTTLPQSQQTHTMGMGHQKSFQSGCCAWNGVSSNEFQRIVDNMCDIVWHLVTQMQGVWENSQLKMAATLPDHACVSDTFQAAYAAHCGALRTKNWTVKADAEGNWEIWEQSGFTKEIKIFKGIS